MVEGFRCFAVQGFSGWGAACENITQGHGEDRHDHDMKTPRTTIVLLRGNTAMTAMINMKIALSNEAQMLNSDWRRMDDALGTKPTINKPLHGSSATN